MWQKLVVVLCVLWCRSVFAAELQGKVVHIADGDTLTVLDGQQQQFKIRLAGIDAPEKKQAFGNVSRQNLARMCFQKDVRVTWEKHDRYGRIIGKVYCDDQDAGLKQIQDGLAWWYRQYAKDQLPRDREQYANVAQEAIATKQGLWRDLAPVPPWDWRRK